MRKNLRYIIVALFFVFIGISNVNAIKMSAQKEVKAGEQIKVTFSEATISSVSSGPLYEFGNNKSANLTRKDFNGFSGIDKLFFTSKDGYVTYITKEINADYEVIFSIKDLGNNAVETVSVMVKSKNPTTTTTTTTTTTPTTATTAPTTTKPAKSNNANLKSLEVKADDNSVILLTPTFKSDVYEYTASVLGKIKKVSITPIVEDQKANVVLSTNSNEELKAGENNKIVITVTAEDGTKKAYTLNIKREALQTNATLKSLFIKESDSFQFDENKFTYDVKVAKDVTSLTLNYVPTSEKAVVSISGNDALEDGSKVKILVTAEDNTKKEYVLNIVKEKKVVTTTAVVKPPVSSERNPLIIMALSLVAFGLIGVIIYVVKK